MSPVCFISNIFLHEKKPKAMLNLMLSLVFYPLLVGLTKASTTSAPDDQVLGLKFLQHFFACRQRVHDQT